MKQGDADDEEVDEVKKRLADASMRQGDFIEKVPVPLCGVFFPRANVGAIAECRHKKIVIAEEACRMSIGRVAAKARNACRATIDIYSDKDIAGQ
jgi:hypothetical protein